MLNLAIMLSTHIAALQDMVDAQPFSSLHPIRYEFFLRKNGVQEIETALASQAGRRVKPDH